MRATGRLRRRTRPETFRGHRLGSHACKRSADIPRERQKVSPIRYKRQRPEQTALYLLVQQHADGFIAHAEAGTGAAL